MRKLIAKLLGGMLVFEAAAVAQVGDSDPPLTREPTMPTYVEQNAHALIEERLRSKYPSVTRTQNNQICEWKIGQETNGRDRKIQFAFLALPQNPPLLGPMMLVAMREHWGGHDHEPRRRVCHTVQVQVPYTGDRAHDIGFDPSYGKVTVGEPIRVSVPDIISEFKYDVPNCTDASQSVTQSLSYSIRTGDQLVVTRGVSVASGQSSKVSAGISFKGFSASGERGTTRTKTVTDTRAQTTSEDVTTTRTATIPLNIPPMSRVTAIASSSQSAYEVPFEIELLITGQLHNTTQLGSESLDKVLSPEERTVTVRGYIKNFVAGDLRFNPVQTKVDSSACARGVSRTLTFEPEQGGRSIIHIQ